MREDRQRAQREDQVVIDDAIRKRFVAMMAGFRKRGTDPSVANRERKRMLAYVIEDATLLKDPDHETTKVFVRFRGGRVETLTTKNPKPS